jgi:PAS domain S-box-containing protein
MANEAVETVLGYTPRELINKNLSLIFTPEDLAYFLSQFTTTGSKKRTVSRRSSW